MPQRATQAKKKDAKVIQISGKLYTDEQAQDFVRRFEQAQGDAQAAIDKGRKLAQPFRDEQKEIKALAKKAGIPAKVFAALLRQRKLIKQARNADASLNDDQKDDLEVLRSKLGPLAETPLGQSALNG